MKVDAVRCLVVLVLSCEVTTAVRHHVVEEEHSVTLQCPRSVGGQVTWSRDANGSRVDIVTVDRDRETRHLTQEYVSFLDKKLLIFNAAAVHSGKYLCNGEAAAELTVIPAGTTIRTVPERSSFALRCPHQVSQWTREAAGHQLRLPHSFQFNRSLVLLAPRVSASGLYYCDRTPLVYLDVVQELQSERTPPSTAATAGPGTPQNPAPSYFWLKFTIRHTIGLVYLIILISIVMVTERKARRIQNQRRRSTETGSNV